jgi:hypothetical protein
MVQVAGRPRKPEKAPVPQLEESARQIDQEVMQSRRVSEVDYVLINNHPD